MREAVTLEILAPLADLFWRKVDRRDPGECWPWQKGTSGRGYGQFHLTPRRTGWDKTVTVGAHRVAWALANRQAPPSGHDFVLDHRCNQPRCCNPAHLSLVPTGLNVKAALSGRSVEPLRSGRYKVRFRMWRDGRTVETSRTFDSPEQAEAFAIELRSDVMPRVSS